MTRRTAPLKEIPCPRCGTPFTHAYRKFCSWQCSLEDAYDRGYKRGVEQQIRASPTLSAMSHEERDKAYMAGYNTAKAAYQSRISELLQRIGQLERSIVELTASAMSRSQQRADAFTVGTITVTLWRSLVHMAHPDRWQGTALEAQANEATRWLLAHRPSKEAGR